MEHVMVRVREGDVPPPTQSEALNPKRILRSFCCPEIGNILEVELFGGEASPVPPSLDETLLTITS